MQPKFSFYRGARSEEEVSLRQVYSTQRHLGCRVGHYNFGQVEEAAKRVHFRGVTFLALNKDCLNEL